VKLPGRKNSDVEPEEPAPSAANTAAEQNPAQTAPKGRPTPKRSDQARRRGPVAPAPMTTAEARARRKELAGPKLTRAERKAARAESRVRMNERREKMMAGDQAYLLPRDKGPIRAYVRDIVDSRAHLLGLFMPGAMFMLFAMVAVPRVQLYISPALLTMMLAMFIEAVLMARTIRGKVDLKFPGNTEKTWSLGTYAGLRASQMRRMRAPRPRVRRGDPID
jgi:Protein of unknown function (DUF3043)